MTEQKLETPKKRKSKDLLPSTEERKNKKKVEKGQKSSQVAAVEAARAVGQDQQAKADDAPVPVVRTTPVVQAAGDVPEPVGVTHDLSQMSDDRKIKISAAFRIKYRVKGPDGKEAPRRNIAPHLVAWHKQSRRGVLPNADRLQQTILAYCGN